MPWKIISSFSIYITTNLSPIPIYILINADSTTNTLLAIISISPYSYYISISRKTQWIAESFINIVSYFCPIPIYILINANVAICTMKWSSNSNYISISRKANWVSRFTTRRISINVVTYFCPGIIDIFIDADMTFLWIICIGIIVKGSYSNNSSISRKAHRMSWWITSRFSIYITTNLSPSTISIFIDTHMPTTITIAIIRWSPNSNNSSIVRKTHRKSWYITSRFSIYIATDLWKSTKGYIPRKTRNTGRSPDDCLIRSWSCKSFNAGSIYSPSSKSIKSYKNRCINWSIT